MLGTEHPVPRTGDRRLGSLLLFFVKVRVLGPVEVTGSGRSPPPKERAVLTVLALGVGTRVPIGRLVDALWGESPPRTAVRGLHAHVSRLRQRMEPGVITEGRDGAYRLELLPDEVDVACFERLAAEGRDSLGSGDSERAAALLSEALALWRGDPGSDVAAGTAAAAEVVRLVELHRSVEELRAEAMLQQGRHDEQLPELERMALAEPLRERRWELLMVALYRCDRP
ncbi:MAG: AfsR/SARP family transcriptional regulator, partial [Acidimicrobiia bacterium]